MTRAMTRRQQFPQPGTPSREAALPARGGAEARPVRSLRALYLLQAAWIHSSASHSLGMKSHTEYLTFNTRHEHEYVHITPQVEKALRQRVIQEGDALVSAMHIT